MRISDWSSDVCSSDLRPKFRARQRQGQSFMLIILKRFLSYYAPHRRLFLLDFSSAVVSGLLELAFPVAVTLFIDSLLPTSQLGLIAAAAIGLLLIYLANAGLQVVVTYWGHMLGINIETEMRRKAFSHLQPLSFGYFEIGRAHV